MNNFEKIKEIENSLAQLTDVLSIVKNNNFTFSFIEKDLILQKLRDIYLFTLHEDQVTELGMPEINMETISMKVEDKEKNKGNLKEKEYLEEQTNEEIRIKTEVIEEKKGYIEEEKETECDEREVEKTISQSEAMKEEQRIEEKVQSKEQWNEEIEITEKSKEEITKIFSPENVGTEDDFSDLFNNTFSSDQNKPEEKQEILENDLFQFLPNEFDLGKKEPAVVMENTIIKNEKTIETQEIHSQIENVRENEPEIYEELQQEIKSEKRSLNDLLNDGKEDKTVGSKFQDIKVTDLTKSISLNDKFLYIKELFQNRGEEFSQAIQILNNCNTIEEAFNEMETMKKHYFWDTTSPAYLSLCDLLRRKFL